MHFIRPLISVFIHFYPLLQRDTEMFIFPSLEFDLRTVIKVGLLLMFMRNTMKKFYYVRNGWILHEFIP